MHKISPESKGEIVKFEEPNLPQWESMYNPSFNSPEFEGIRNEAGSNRFLLSVQEMEEGVAA